MTTKAKTKKPEYDLSDFAIDEGVSLLEAVPDVQAPSPAAEARNR